MDSHMIEVLRDFQEELTKPRPNLQKVYQKWAGPNFDAMFKYDEEGNILFNVVKNPKEYKKIVFNYQK